MLIHLWFLGRCTVLDEVSPKKSHPIRLISTQLQDGEPSLRRPITTYGKTIRISHEALIVSFFVFLGIIIPLSVVHAAFFKRAQANNALLTDVSQTPIRLLETPFGGARALTAEGGPEILIQKDTLVPEIGALGTARDLYDVPTGSAISVYTVREGDTLSQIATMFGVSSNTIRWANDLGPRDPIRIGQELLILPITGVRHTITSGDTLATLATKYKGDADEIAQFNGLESGQKLVIGETIIIPQGELTPPPVPTPTRTASSSTSSRSSSTGTERCGISPSASACVPPTQTSLAGPAASDGYFIRPVVGIVTQWFHGPYQAVDIGAPTGTPIVAAAGGRVITARTGWNGGYGTMVIIEHPNKSQSLYAHASKLHVKAGDTVTQGQLIAEVGNTGRSTGPHLHLEFRGIKTPIIYKRPASM